MLNPFLYRRYTCLLLIFFIGFGVIKAQRSSGGNFSQPELALLLDVKTALNNADFDLSLSKILQFEQQNPNPLHPEIHYEKITILSKLSLESPENFDLYEKAINLFLSNVNYHSLATYKYLKVELLYYSLIKQRKIDQKNFLTLSRKTVLSDTLALQARIDSINKYLLTTENSKYIDTLSYLEYVLTDAMMNIKHEVRRIRRDSLSLLTMSKLGLFSIIEVTFLTNFQGQKPIAFNDQSSANSFFGGEGVLTPNIAIGGSFLNFGINLNKSNKFKIMLVTSLLDFNLHHFTVRSNNRLERFGSSTPTSPTNEFYSLHLGGRIGLMPTFRTGKNSALGFYIQFRPAYNYLMFQHNLESDPTMAEGTVTFNDRFQNFNASYEVGLKYFLGNHFDIALYFTPIHYNWQINVQSANGEVVERLRADYKFNAFGLRLGF
jgi:hypothetical protein